jgi:hypothetical protein
MSAGVALVLLSNLDLNTLLPLSREILGYSPAKAADGVTIPLSNSAHQLACVAAFKDSKAPPTVRVAIPYLELFHAGFLIAADERDLVDILEISAMPFVITDTLQRGIQVAIVSGTLDDWARAVKLACHPQASINRDIRYVYNAIYTQLCNIGLKDIFGDLRTTELHDKTFLLEDKR